MLTPSGGIVGLVVFETHVVETALVAPEVRHNVANGHHSSLTTGVDVRSRSGIVKHVEAEGILQVYRRATPFAPYITVFIDTGHAEV